MTKTANELHLASRGNRPESMLPESPQAGVARLAPEPSGQPSSAKRASEAVVPTRYGTFRLVAYLESPSDKEHVAIVSGAPVPGVTPLVRVHSECLTGEVIYSLKCDCRDQLDRALGRIAAAPWGAVIYLRQEGRGIGLINKLKAYALQDEQGLDTVDANRALGFEDDLRDYNVAGQILRDLGMTTVRLLTNNPDKVEGLQRAGIEVAERLAHFGDGTPHNADYLEAKARRMRHDLPLPSPPLPEE